MQLEGPKKSRPGASSAKTGTAYLIVFPVANLFAKDELDEITNELVPIMKKKQPKRPPTRDNLYDFFISSARNNLHITLCFSPVGEKFRSRSLKFPGLISGCTMDWFSRWPKDALVAVSNHFLVNFPIVSTATVKQSLIAIMADVQDIVADTCIQYYARFRRQSFVTPKSFLSFLDGYKTIYAQRQADINVLAEQMNMGLEKLREAAISVDELRKDLVEKEKDILVASAKAEEVLSGVTQVASVAEKVKAEVKEVADRATAIVEEIAVDKAIAEEKLEDARPALEEAEAALLTIKAADIATVRKLGKPPYLVTLIMDVVLILFQRKVDQVRPDMEKNFFFPNWAESLKAVRLSAVHLQKGISYRRKVRNTTRAYAHVYSRFRSNLTERHSPLSSLVTAKTHLRPPVRVTYRRLS
ncbi:Dynein heavy chain 5, axonemal [Homalodisca vitripennis]|nr:Dynein heavy chain 5, axonemal [Homalodisca vitripennis]